MASGIFAGEALILFILTLIPHANEPLPGRWVIPAGCALCALVLHITQKRIGPAALQTAATCGTLLVSLHVLHSAGGPSLSSELLYGWLALYAAYFFTARQAAAQLALMSGAYLAVLLASVPADDVMGSWLTLVAVIFPAAALVRGVRDGVRQLVQSLLKAARTDTLTGLKNRLALEGEIEVEIERALRSETMLSIIIGDLDHFKAVNDELGHRAGDDALVRIGRILATLRRTGDSIARTGGEEFTLLLRAPPSTSPTWWPSACAPRSSATSRATPCQSPSALASPPIPPTVAAPTPCSSPPTKRSTRPRRSAATAR